MRGLPQLMAGASALGLLVASVPLVASDTTTFTYDALGRLVKSSISGGSSNGWKTQNCFDQAGNRTRYDLASETLSSCSAPAPSPSPSPSPSSNTPPTAVDDSFNLPCHTSGTVNLLANDTDSDGNLPLSLVSITRTAGESTATIISGDTVRIDAGSKGPSDFTYVVKDSLGATASANLHVISQGSLATCDGGF